MDILFVALVALLASGLTLFSGLGLGTILTPTFTLLIPIEVAVGATALVHLANNLVKLAHAGAARAPDATNRKPTSHRARKASW